MNLQEEYRPMTVGDWIITMILLAIPLVNIIMLFVWAFGGGTQASKKSYCQAVLILAGVVIVLGIIFGVIFGGFAYLTTPELQS